MNEIALPTPEQSVVAVGEGLGQDRRRVADPTAARPDAPMSEAGLAATQAAGASSPGAGEPPVSLGPRLGRFMLLERIGAGSMGVVVAAYDDVLDRKVAVKVLQGGGEAASLRLLREAQAMARVDHPNVVTVHEVGTSDGQVYVAMEFIRGVTLQVWQREPGRTWTEIVDAYIQAGRGLAAAHAAGLVHRDFKPSNAMIDADGRVRVLDFGLVRAQVGAGEAPQDSSASRSSIAIQLTHVGDVVGTPAYMAPEQIRGLDLGPAADQFSLCVSLYEGLFGRLPFAGDNLAALFAAIMRRRIVEPPRGSRVPAWLRAVLRRGLHPVPEDRYPSVTALLRALGAGSGRRRRLGIGLGVGATVAAALAGFLAARTQTPELCTGAEAQLAGVWGPPARAAVAGRLSAAGPAFDAELRPAVLAALDVYAAQWKATHRDSCLAHTRGEQSDLLLDRRMACLEQRKGALAAAVGVLAEADAAVALEALRVVNDLPPIARCSEVEVLAEEVLPPTDPAVGVAVAEVRRGLARAEALARAGKIDAALELAERGVQEALATDYRPLAAEALLVRARLALNLIYDPKDEQRLTRAMLTAIGSGMDEVAAEAAALRIYVCGRYPQLVPQALDDLPLAEELARRLAQPQAILGLLANNVGTVHLARGDRRAARAAFEQALERRERALPPNHPELGNTLFNLALVEDASEAREAHLLRALSVFSLALGPAHPQVIGLRMEAAHYVQDPNDAGALLLPGCEALARFLPDDLPRRAVCLAELGHHAAEAGDAAAAVSRWREARALVGADDPSLDIAAMRLRGEPDDARLVRLRRAIAGLESDAPTWWQRRQRAELHMAVGEQLGRGADAIAALSTAVHEFQASSADARDVFGQQCLARAHLLLAELLLDEPEAATGQEQISRHLDAAEAWYRGAGAAYAWRLAALDELRARLRLALAQ